VLFWLSQEPVQARAKAAGNGRRGAKKAH
jgi:hypothetical protein